MKILHVLNTSTFSGAENVAVTIIKNYKENFHGAYASLNGVIKNKLEKENIQYYSMNNMSVKELKRVVIDYKPDIIHAHDFTTSVIASLINADIPIISHLHNNVPWLKRPGVYSIAYLLSSIKFQQILGVSNSIFEEYFFRDLIKDKTKVISNPIDSNEVVLKANNGKNEYYDIVFLGRLAPEKDPIKFINLISLLVERIPELKVAMIGTGGLQNECIERIKHLKLDKNIKMLGFMNNPYKILSMAKVLCMTSLWEGFGLVAVEALVLGTPVVAYPVGGLVNIVNESSGLLASNDNEYIEEVEKLIKDEEYWAYKSYNAKKRASEFDNIDKYMDGLTTLYKKLSLSSEVGQ